MIFRKKPNSDERDFSLDIDTHVYELCQGPHPLWERGAVSKGRVRFTTQIGQESRWADIQIEVDWGDIVRCIEMCAKNGLDQAIQLTELIKVQEQVRQAKILAKQAEAKAKEAKAVFVEVAKRAGYDEEKIAEIVAKAPSK